MILLWRISTKCNFGCGFCAYDRNLAMARADADPSEVARVVRLFHELASQRQVRLHVSWLGGEPFLWSPLLALSQNLVALGDIAISATTNGSRLGVARVRQHILTCFTELTISIDGPAEVHNQLRGVPNSFEKIEKAVAMLGAERAQTGAVLKLRVNVVLMQRTVPHLTALCHTLANWGVDEITFNQLGGRDRPEFFPANGLRPDDAAYLRDTVPVLAKEMKDRGVLLCANALYLDRIVASSRGEPLSVADCQPGEAFYFVDEAGIIAPCGFTSQDYGIPVSELRTTGDVAALPKRFRELQATRRSTACDDCLSTQMFGKFAG